MPNKTKNKRARTKYSRTQLRKQFTQRRRLAEKLSRVKKEAKQRRSPDVLQMYDLVIRKMEDYFDGQVIVFDEHEFAILMSLLRSKAQNLNLVCELAYFLIDQAE